ncbi:type II toxin-antitoxin system VapC family toxin [Parapedobacter koreensis]|uniref:Predicted nucleic acid-binding protein, contains PIN domain n=1 Tax=Parapedobacter koreensis TaxID=332977 RepID=A0A1H7SPW8_9SPHI|nr:PIN domain-containing protein [Parapedobacter koreensis]SEL74439.1 Predicted nucleic acid-binding protein, contains PIN domain [Parapedobacter koreensis]
MKKLFIDTNIVIDLLAKRADFYKDAQELFSLPDYSDTTLYISALTFANTNYLLLKHYKPKAVRGILVQFKVLVNILTTDDRIIELALGSDFDDFEDATQHYTALVHDMDAIITRNKRDFKTANLPVMTARELLNTAP